MACEDDSISLISACKIDLPISHINYIMFLGIILRSEI